MECHTISQALIRLILAFPPSPTMLSPYSGILDSISTRLSQSLKNLAERYATLYNFRQLPGMVFHYITVIAYICLESED